jgi:hypothetical protein
VEVGRVSGWAKSSAVSNASFCFKDAHIHNVGRKQGCNAQGWPKPHVYTVCLVISLPEIYTVYIHIYVCIYGSGQP